MPTVQLPLPLVTVLPFMGDDSGCHLWNMDDLSTLPDISVEVEHG